MSKKKRNSEYLCVMPDALHEGDNATAHHVLFLATYQPFGEAYRAVCSCGRRWKSPFAWPPPEPKSVDDGQTGDASDGPAYWAGLAQQTFEMWTALHPFVPPSHRRRIRMAVVGRLVKAGVEDTSAENTSIVSWALDATEAESDVALHIQDLLSDLELVRSSQPLNEPQDTSRA